MATVLRTLATLVLAAPSVQGWNAASVWGVATNASYFPSIANVLFEISLEDAVVAHATNGATGLYTLDWTVPRDPARPVCPSPIPRFHNTTHCVTMRPDIDTYWADTYTTLEPFRANGTLSGIFLGDERMWDGASLANLSYVAHLIRRDWPEAIIYINEAQDVFMCNFNRLNETIFEDGECIPREVTWFGFDIYAYNVSVAYGASREAIETNLFSRMRRGQYVIPTTDGFGGHDGGFDQNWTLAQYDRLCQANAEAWFTYAADEPRIGGVFPWHWQSLGGISVPYGVGLEDLPLCRAAYEAWGLRVRANVPGGRVRPHVAVPDTPCRPAAWHTDPAWNWCDTHH
eukprot:m.215514 g.215514  ORF g.215514 m.215514 type:complete len:344 (-) comp27917_c0_seq1:112-1143(-)